MKDHEAPIRGLSDQPVNISSDPTNRLSIPKSFCLFVTGFCRHTFITGESIFCFDGGSVVLDREDEQERISNCIDRALQGCVLVFADTTISFNTKAV
jgi:hypothetical protein